MRIGGKEIVKQSATPVTLIRKAADGTEVRYTFLVSPMASDFNVKLRRLKLKDFPKPPLKVVVDLAGKVVRGPDKLAQTYADYEDPEYLNNTFKVSRQVAVLRFRHVLRNDPDITFDTVEPTEESTEAWITYAAELATELEQAGLTSEEISAINSVADKIANGIDIEEAAEVF